MTNIIEERLRNGYSYKEYRNRITQLLLEGKASGTVQSDDYAHYTLLNESRIKRLDKTMVIVEDCMVSLSNLKGNYTWLVISEGWCGDAAQILPVLHKMSLVSNNIDMRLVFRDENPDLMDLFLTNGNRAIPIVIVVESNQNKVLAHWGPRPKGAAELILRAKAEYGKINEQAKTDLQLWYLNDKGISTQEELVTLMEAIETKLQ